MNPLKIFIGYDKAESVAYHAMVQSIINHASVPVTITPVKMTMLPMYKRPRDPRQSNEFSFTRFLTPYLAGYNGWALFMDCDMMLREDIKKLFDLADPTKAVMVVKHDYTPKDETKYLGNVQYNYPRKNWSSVMLFNCAHYHCRKLTPEYVNTAEPGDLHQFKWTEDRFIGELPKTWNHLVGEYPYDSCASNVHWTIGGPYFYEYMGVDYSDEWRCCFDDMKHCDQLVVPTVKVSQR